MAERREGTAPDGVPTRIGQVAMLRHAGDREEARRRFLLLWTEVGEHGDPLHRCTLAHYLAGTHDDPGDALAWDLRALTAAGRSRATAPRAAREAPPCVPSTRRCICASPPATPGSAAPTPPAPISSGPAARPGHCPATATARACGRPSAGWRPCWAKTGRPEAGEGRDSALRAWTPHHPRGQRPYVSSQMTASWLPGRQPPYCLPSAQRSGPPDGLPGIDAAAPGRPAGGRPS